MCDSEFIASLLSSPASGNISIGKVFIDISGSVAMYALPIASLSLFILLFHFLFLFFPHSGLSLLHPMSLGTNMVSSFYPSVVFNLNKFLFYYWLLCFVYLPLASLSTKRFITELEESPESLVKLKLAKAE